MLQTQNNCHINTTTRTIFLGDDIDEKSMSYIQFYLLELIHADDEKDSKEKDFKREPIKMYINSHGGSVDNMWRLIDIMLHSKTPIHTYCTGYAYSAGFKIFLAGSKRYCYKHSMFCYHQLSSWIAGKYQDLVEEREFVDTRQKEIEDYVADRTNMTKKLLKDIKIKKKDFYIRAEDAIEYGIVDVIL
jgi:ATP-dependent Clp protease protease subunit